MPRPTLTDEQKRAATERHGRIFIEAHPGAGKTTVAAERYGILRFNERQPGSRSVTAVSFTRSATAELNARIRHRWGSSALSWPHGVSTIDALVHAIVQHLLRTGEIHWPGGHRDIQAIDDWRGRGGYRWLTAGSYRRVCSVNAQNTVVSRAVRLEEPRFGFGNRMSFEEHLANGFCTHDDLRAVLAGALRNPHLHGRVSAYIGASVGRLVVDEVFDANRLDLYLVRLACYAGVQVTLVGDPWQALYGFRGASPELVPSLIQEGQFERLPLSRSFRFETDVMQDLARDLRAGTATTLRRGGQHDVVLASSWDGLWQAPDHVLPLSFGMTTNRSDAAAIVLLNHLLQSRFSERTIFLPEAVLLLELDPDAYRLLGAAVLGNVVDTLGRQGPTEALRALRSAMVELGAPRRLRAGRAAAEERQLNRLAALARRVRAPRVVPGMTVHQAKGREWNYVGVRLSDGEAQSLAGGLSQDIEGHRALYVALTRARCGVTRVG